MQSTFLSVGGCVPCNTAPTKYKRSIALGRPMRCARGSANVRAESLQPVHPIVFSDRRCGEKARECHDQIFGVAVIPAMKPPW
jgi:hypothetical protein